MWPWSHEFQDIRHAAATLNWGFPLEEAEKTAEKWLAFLTEGESHFRPISFHGRILEIGSGYGRLSRVMKRFAQVQGADTNPIHRRLYTEYTGGEFTLFDGLNLPLESETFDFVVCSLVYKHLPLPVVFVSLSEAYRLLKPSGKFIFDVYSEETNKLLPEDSEKNFLYRHPPEAIAGRLHVLGFHYEGLPYAPQNNDRQYQLLFIAQK